MRRLNNLLLLAVGVAAGVAGSYWYTQRPEPISTPVAAEASHPAGGERKILYYRNPMGLPDTSPVPKKDTMGMEYIPVYADEQDEPGTVKVSLDKIQRIGVKTEKVEAPPDRPRAFAAVGTVEHDESLLTIVTVRSDGFIEELFVNKTGQHVNKGEPLFRFYSPQIQSPRPTSSSPCAREARKTGLEADNARRRHATLAQSRCSTTAASRRSARR